MTDSSTDSIGTDTNGDLAVTTSALHADDGGTMTTQRILTIFYTVVGVIGLLGNLFVVIVISTSANMRKKWHNIFIINQSVLDLTASILLMITINLKKQWFGLAGAAGELYCRFWVTDALLWGCLVASTYNLMMVSLERYAAVVHPIWHKTSLRGNQVGIGLALVWSVWPIYNLSFHVPTSGLVNGVCFIFAFWPTKILQTVFTLIIIIFSFFAPLIVISFCYIKMAIALKKQRSIHQQPEAQIQRQTAPITNSMHAARKNIVKTLAWVSIAFVLCWVWNEVFFLVFQLGCFCGGLEGPYYQVTLAMVYCGCCINPFIYTARYKQFQAATKALLGARGKNSGGSSLDQATITQNTST